MIEYKKINEKEIWIIVKKYSGGLIEFLGAYWIEDTAKRVAASNLPSISDQFTISLTTVTLHGLAVDVK